MWDDGIRRGVGGGCSEGIGPWAALSDVVGDVEEWGWWEVKELDFESAEDFAFAFAGLDE